jgi:chemotaxis protein methyltransferase CheR
MTVTPLDTAEITAVMDRIHGRDISAYDASFLVKSIGRRLAATGSPSSADYCRSLSEDSTEAKALFDSLNISYSEFFRSPLSFALLEQILLPALTEEKNRTGQPGIRIWSAGCAAGQEAYSIAMLMDELTALNKNSVAYRIFATDASEPDLLLAKQGFFSGSVVQNIRLKHLRKYFTQVGETYSVNAALRDRIDFSIHNLLDAHSSYPPTSIYGEFDLITCSNLLFYYRPTVRQFILNRFHRCLSSKGYLVTGEAEREIVSKTEGFRAAMPPAAVFQKIP